jgi:hypothetical protein
MASAFHLEMYHTVPRPVHFIWQYVIRCTTTSAFHLAMYHTVPWPVPFTWQCVIGSTISATCQCVIRYHDKCLSPGNMSYGVQRPVHFTWKYVIRTTISASHLEMYHTVPRPVHFTWQYVIRYHDQCISPGYVSYGTTTSARHLAICHTVYSDQCISPGNVSYGTSTSAFHLAMCYTVPRPVPFTWQYVIRYHDQCLSPGNVSQWYHDQYLSYDNASYGTTTSAFHLAMCHTVPRPAPFTWQCVIRYHDPCLSLGNVS